jgi:hypothetical protein
MFTPAQILTMLRSKWRESLIGAGNEENTLLADVFDECRTTQEHPACKDTDIQGNQRKSS